jgi:tRNA(Ile)-lysidine synthase
VPPVSALTARDFRALITPLLPAGCASVAVAVSGGPDSMALLLLAQGWAEKAGLTLQALTVDHRLRPESAAEARQVAAWCGARSIAHRTLVWRGAKPASNIQAAARAARYALMLGWCRRHRAGALLVAHHLEDQAETVLLRLGRGSGVDGLAGMRPAFDLDGIRIVRPLLAVPRARLRAVLDRAGQAAIDDPSNRNEAYQRVKVRQALDLLAPDGVAAVHVAATAARMRRVEAALRAATDDLLQAALPLQPLGWCRIDRPLLAVAPEEIALRALRQRLCAIGGDPLPPRLDRLERFRADLLAGRPGTLHRCRALQWKGAWVLVRELRHLPEPSPGGGLWDGRFPAARRKGLTVAAVGEGGLTQLRETGFAGEKDVPHQAVAALPGYWRSGRLMAVPALKWRRGRNK